MPDVSRTPVAQEQAMGMSAGIRALRNVMRLAISQVAYTRGLFPENCFSNVSLADLQLRSLGGTKKTTPKAMQLISWMEDGAFEALTLGYLVRRRCESRPPLAPARAPLSSAPLPCQEKCILVISHDEAGRDVIEAWELSVQWHDDEPQFNVSLVNTPKAASCSVQPAAGRITKELVRDVSKLMLRQLLTMMQYLPKLPETYYIGLQLVHRDSTPANYEAAGFHDASGEQAGVLSFATRPNRTVIGTQVVSSAGSLQMGLITPDAPDSAGVSTSQEQAAESRGQRWAWNLADAAPAPSSHDDLCASLSAARDDDEAAKKSYGAAKKLLLELGTGSRIRADGLSSRIGELAPTPPARALRPRASLHVCWHPPQAPRSPWPSACSTSSRARASSRRTSPPCSRARPATPSKPARPPRRRAPPPRSRRPLRARKHSSRATGRARRSGRSPPRRSRVPA